MGDETPKSEREWILRKEEAKLLRYRKKVLVELPILVVLTGLFLAGDRLGLFPPDSASRYGAAVVLALAGTNTLGSIMNWLMYRRLVAEQKKNWRKKKAHERQAGRIHSREDRTKGKQHMLNQKGDCVGGLLLRPEGTQTTAPSAGNLRDEIISMEL